MNLRRRLVTALISHGSALDLAVFRITVALVIAQSHSVAVATTWAALPSATRTAPLGVGWLLPHLPIDPASVAFMRGVLLLACALGALGVFTRASFTIISLTAAYVLLIPELGGAVFHDHHLLWFAVLLAASPCGDTLSFDAWLAQRRGRPRPTHGRAHGLTLRVAWLLVALIFFFPGVHKLATSGLAWVTSDNLRNQIWWKWTQDPTLEPAFRIDLYPRLLRACAALTIAFELSFPVLILSVRGRAVALAAALSFHAATAHFMGIEFGVLYACYVVFIPWEALGRRLGIFTPVEVQEDELQEPSLAFPMIVSGVLVTGVACAGSLGAMQAYPFACYPTFEWIARAEMPALVVELVRPNGSRERVDRSVWSEPGPRGWALEWRLAGVYDAPSPRRIDAWWSDVSTRPPLALRVADAESVVFRSASISVDPAHRGRLIRSRAIHQIDLPALRSRAAPPAP